MPRTNATLVRSIMRRDPPPADMDLSYFVTTANTMIDLWFPTGTYSEAVMGVQETWLAAHYVAVDLRRLQRVQAGPSEDEYDHVKPGDGLKATEYGKQVLAMDPKRLIERVLIKTWWAGKQTCP